MPTLLVPAAGFGKRVGSPRAKELLADERGLPMIDWCIEHARDRKWKSVVVTRAQKTELIEYLAFKRSPLHPVLETCEIKESLEWPDSLLQSQLHWSENNLVVLPDTRFKPAHVLDQLSAALRQGAHAAFALFDVNEETHGPFCAWGIVDPSRFVLCEKPREIPSGMEKKNCKAWGAFGFKKHYGKELLELMLESTLSHRWQKLSRETKFAQLESFVDLTRPL
ncbi:MAG: NTP transferase domain-containing protein [Bdellovibrionota bacterium]